MTAGGTKPAHECTYPLRDAKKAVGQCSSPGDPVGFLPPAQDPGVPLQTMGSSQMVSMQLVMESLMPRGVIGDVWHWTLELERKTTLFPSYLIKPPGTDRGELGVESSASPLSLLLWHLLLPPPSIPSSPALPPSRLRSRL